MLALSVGLLRKRFLYDTVSGILVELVLSDLSSTLSLIFSSITFVKITPQLTNF